jgi:transcriptional regulator with XRE-family HTH domain
VAKSPVGDEQARARREIGRRLRWARTALGMTQRQLAEALDVTPLSVLHWEAGRTPFATDRLPALECIGIDSAWIISGLPSMETATTRETFSAILSKLEEAARRGDGPEDLAERLDLAWRALRALCTEQLPDFPATEEELATAVQHAIAETLPTSKPT